MHVETKHVSKTISEVDPEVFDQKLNEFMNLALDNPTIHFHERSDRFAVTVIAMMKTLTPETLAEKYELQGIHYYCLDCGKCKEPRVNTAHNGSLPRVCERKNVMVDGHDAPCDWFFEELEKQNEK